MKILKGIMTVIWGLATLVSFISVVASMTFPDITKQVLVISIVSLLVSTTTFLGLMTDDYGNIDMS
jgi:hypothetical protein